MNEATEAAVAALPAEFWSNPLPGSVEDAINETKMKMDVQTWATQSPEELGLPILEAPRAESALDCDFATMSEPVIVCNDNNCMGFKQVSTVRRMLKNKATRCQTELQAFISEQRQEVKALI